MVLYTACIHNTMMYLKYNRHSHIRFGLVWAAPILLHSVPSKVHWFLWYHCITIGTNAHKDKYCVRSLGKSVTNWKCSWYRINCTRWWFRISLTCSVRVNTVHRNDLYAMLRMYYRIGDSRIEITAAVAGIGDWSNKYIGSAGERVRYQTMRVVVTVRM